MAAKFTKLQDAARIEGLALIPAESPQTSHVNLQYSDANDDWFEVRMPLIVALQLLNQLEGMSRTHGFETLRWLPHD